MSAAWLARSRRAPSFHLLPTVKSSKWQGTTREFASQVHRPNPTAPTPLVWREPPRNVLLVKKPGDTRTLGGARKVIEHLRSAYPSLSVLVEASVGQDLRADYPSLLTFDEREKLALCDKVDLVIALGGDGTVLHTSSLFDCGPVPPVLGLTLGTLGFLLPCRLDQFERHFASVIDGQATVIPRMRLHASVRSASGSTTDRFGVHGANAMNEVSLHRGSSPHMTSLHAYVDSQHLTEAVADGLVVATPTGSTAYSLSAGGPIVHPAVETVLLTPICPRSLSFRTVLLPSEVNIQLKVESGSRSPAELSLDGREVHLLHPGEFLNVSRSRFPVPCIASTSSDVDPGRKADDSWVRDINDMLSFNTTFKAKGARHAAMLE